MATGGQPKTRSERVAALRLVPKRWERAWRQLRRGEFWGRVLLFAGTAAVLAMIIRVWEPPFSFRSGDVPGRDVVARVPFSHVDPRATELARDRARWQVRQVYVHDPAPLVQLRAELRNKLLEVLAAPSFEELDPQAWDDFEPSPDRSAAALKRSRERYQAIVKALGGDEGLAEFDKAVADAMSPWAERGVLMRRPQRSLQANQNDIVIYPVGRPEERMFVLMSDVLLGEAPALRQRLRDRLGSPELADTVHAWLLRRRLSTLTPDDAKTQEALSAAIESVGDVRREYAPGQTIVEAGRTLDSRQLELLRQEHEQFLAGRSWIQRSTRAAGLGAVLLGCMGLAAAYLQFRQAELWNRFRRLLMMMSLVVLTVAVGRWAASLTVGAEIIPLLLFAQSAAIAYRRELALIFAGGAALFLVFALGQGLAWFILLFGVTAVAVLQLDRIRSRAKLIHTALAAAAVAVGLRLVLAAANDRPLDLDVLAEAGRLALWTLLAGFLMTGLVPFIERLFGVLTDMSLLELGDVSHPLLQELVRRAPSTYNHSINVGAIAEAAADAIGARGLLVRVGAYFHDIGKMLKPGYFIENAAPADNLHDALAPRMSTLVIVAHVKDGADLARQHNVPQPIVDFIEQHHGTTLVEYFYGRASRQSRDGPNGGEVDEGEFRYPGPRPLTKETAVLMLADAVESACRTLVDPTPARIENLVREIADRKLDDGQFDDSNLTLRELRTIEDSMIKSLISTYHSRIKYPEPRPA